MFQKLNFEIHLVYIAGFVALIAIILVKVISGTTSLYIFPYIVIKI